MGVGPGVLFAGGAFLASASWQLGLAATGSGIGHVLTGDRARRSTAVVSGLLVLLLAVRLAFS
jgi:arginine exporter protein ArgO